MAMSSSSESGKADSRRGYGKVITAAVLLAVGVVLVVYQLRPQPNISGNFTQGFFTDDDGATYFADALTQIPPFDHNGKPAVRAHVYQADNGSKYVGFLERYTPKAHDQMVDADAKHKAGQLPDEAYRMIISNPGIQQQGLEYKEPGASEKWVPAPSFRADQVKSPVDSSKGVEIFP